MNRNITTYINSKVVEPIRSCSYDGSNKLTKDVSVLDLGMNRLQKNKCPLAGSLADVRIYMDELSATEVNATYNFTDTDTEYIEVIEMATRSRPEPTGTQLSMIAKADLTKKPAKNQWVYIQESLSYSDAKDVCQKFGGSLLDIFSIDLRAVLGYTRNVIKSFFSNYWVASLSNNTCLVVSVSPAGIKFETLTECDTLRHSVCSVPRSNVYHIIGRNKITTGDEKISLRLLDDSFTFDADYQIRLAYSEENLACYIMDSTTKQIYAEMNYLIVSNLFGRHEWNYVVPETGKGTITLTSCNETQFTCSNGHCIDLENICNFEADCLDFSDEHLCNYTQSRPEYYDRQLSGARNLTVQLTVQLLRVLELDMEAGENHQ